MLQLYINNQLADIKDESIISVTKTYESVNNPTLYYSSFSKTVKLPISRNNNKIFSNFNRLDSVVTNVSIDPAKKLPFVITNNREPMMEGYLQLNNANTIYTDEAYEVTLYSSLGLIFNQIKLLTFNKNAEGVDPMYVIDSPISEDLKINRNLVKNSFEQQTHQLDSDNIYDWIGFIPTYQGKYSDFASDKEQLMPSGRTEDMSRERDEHYTREFRSYYQQPFIWVDKLWKVVKDKIEQITDYTINLDKSWFTSVNPYYSQLIYTCPSLFTSDDNFKSISEKYEEELNKYTYWKPSKTPTLNTHKLIHIDNLQSNTYTGIYDNETGIFNPEGEVGGTVFKGSMRLTLSTPLPSLIPDTSYYAKILDDNPFYVKIKAVNADTGEDILGASKTFLLYSDDTDAASYTYDEAIDLGITSIGNADVTVGVTNRPNLYSTGYHTATDAYFWEADLNFSINVTENVPYKMYFEIWNANNSDPFETCGVGLFAHQPTWDWLWTDFFVTSGNADKGFSMYFDTVYVACETQENLRSGSDVSLYRIFPKDTTLFDVILNYSKVFGLMWKVNDDEKTVTVMSRNRFFADSAIKDWSDKVDRSKEFKFNPLTFDKRYVEFNFDEGKCGRLERYESMYEYTYGSKKLDTGYEFNSEENKLYSKLTPSVVSQKRQYSRMMNTEYPDRPNFMGYSYMVYPQERYVDNDNGGSNAGMSGAFYFRNGTFIPDSQISGQCFDGTYAVTITDDTAHQIQTQEYCWNLTGDNTVICRRLPDVSTISNKSIGKRWSVHFESPKEYFFATPDGDIEYIYNCFWENYINERYCSQNKKLTAYVYITPEEYKAIDFTEFVKIDNILYHIDKIYDYNFNSYDPVKMDLAQVWDLSAYTEGQWQFPYLYTVPETATVTTTDQTVNVYASGEWDIVTTTVPDWITCTKNGNSLSIRANSDTDTVRACTINLILGAYLPSILLPNYAVYQLKVRQFPSNPYRLEVDRNTLVFTGNGGDETVIVDCHNLTNNAIGVTNNARWISAAIMEYTQDTDRRRDCLHLVVSASRNISTRPRNGSVTLSISAGGNTYTQTINIGQQGGNTHTRDHNEVVITEDNDFEVYDDNDTRVTTTLASGTQYHFSDLFPEEIDVHTLAISGGTVHITGNSGRQTVTFTPQLADGATEGGGMITARTVNGNIVSYNYNVESPTPAPVSRKMRVSADVGGMFRIEAVGSSMRPQTTNYFEDKFSDGTVINLYSLAEEGYVFREWSDSVGHHYRTPDIVVTVDSSLVDTENLINIKVSFEKGDSVSKLAIHTGTGGYITVGSDTTHYTDYEKTIATGGTIANVRAYANTGYTFVQWSDGSTQQTRDFTMYRDLDLSVIYSGGNDSKITVDAGGIIGANDSLVLRLDGNDIVKCLIGEVKTVTVPDGVYALEVIFKNESGSVFDWFDIDGVQYTTNPYTDPAFTLSNDITIKMLASVPVVQRDIKINTNGLVGQSDSLVLKLNGNTIATVPADQIVNVSVPEGTYRLELEANIDAGSVFEKFTINGTDFTANPYIVNNYVINRNLTIGAYAEQNEYFYVEDITGRNDNQISIVKRNANAPDIEVFKSTDGETWESMGTTSTTAIKADIPANGKLYLKANTDSWYVDYGNTITASGIHNVGGNIMSLLYGDNYVGKTAFPTGSSYNFSRLFYQNTTLVSAEDIILPATTLTDYCYRQMFYGTPITQTPVLPATTLATQCYYGMFNGCTALTVAPALPATTLAQSCYMYMFGSCTALTTAPVLPATTLANACYNNMFRGCTSLAQAPALPATTLANTCYYSMFNGCTSLTTAPELPTTTVVFQCYQSMFQSCTSLTTAPVLPATILAGQCYYSMFSGCTSLVKVTTYATDISATSCISNWLNNVAPSGDFYNEGGANYTLDSGSGIPTGWTHYQPYFYVEDITGRSNTLKIKKDDILSTTLTVYKSTDRIHWESMGNTSTTGISAEIPTNGRLYLKCTASAWGSSISVCNSISASGMHNVGGNIMSLLNGDNFIGTTLSSAYTFVRLFNGDSMLVDASALVLPSDTYNTCYYEMFQNCTGLITPPVLPAKALARQCYEKLFNGCARLQSVTTYATDISATQCLNNWMQNVSATGDFYNYGGATYPTGVSGIPTGWTIHTS